MDAEQTDLFDLLFPVTQGELCKSLKEATLNDCGVFDTYRVMFQGGTFTEGNRVVISIAKKSPFIYFSFDCDTNLQGRGDPCMENAESRFKETDSKEDVMRMISERLDRFCEGIGITETNKAKALNNMKEFI